MTTNPQSYSHFTNYFYHKQSSKIIQFIHDNFINGNYPTPILPWQETPLYMALQWGLMDVVEALIACGYQEEQYAHKRCIVHAGAQGGIQALKVAIEIYKGSDVGRGMSDVEIANVDERRGEEKGPLFSAESIEVMAYLIQMGADVNGRYAGQTLLHYHAKEYQRTAFIRLLVECGVDVNALSDDGKTALHFAASENAFNCVKVLVELGVDVNVEDELGDTAIDIAENLGYSDLVYYLWMNGADFDLHRKDDEKMEWIRPIFRGTPHIYCFNFLKLHSLGDMIYLLLPDGLYSINLNEYVMTSVVDLDGKYQNNHFVLDTKNSDPSVQISEDKLEVFLSGEHIRTEDEVFGVFSESFFDPNVSSYGYAEVKIIDQIHGTSPVIALVPTTFSNFRDHPVWQSTGFGYIGETGKIFCSGSIKRFGPVLRQGDTAGIGINYSTHEVFFTVNGKFIGSVSDSSGDDPYKLMIVLQPHNRARVNFGREPFLYKFGHKMVYYWQEHKYDCPPFQNLHKSCISSEGQIYVLDGSDKLYFLDTDRKRFKAISDHDITFRSVFEIVNENLYIINLRQGKVAIYHVDKETVFRTEIEIDGLPDFYDKSIVVGDRILFWKYQAEDIYIYDTSAGTLTHAISKNYPRFQYSIYQRGGKVYTINCDQSMYCLDTKTMKWNKFFLNAKGVNPLNGSPYVSASGDTVFFLSLKGETDIFMLSKVNENEDMIRCFDTNLFSDVQVVCEGNTIYAHKIILSSYSQYFRDGLSDPDTCVIKVYDIPFSFLSAVINFLYTQQFMISSVGSENMREWMRCVEDNFPELKDVLIDKILMSNIDEERSMRSMRDAWEQCEWSDLKLTSGSEEFHVHKVILSSRNEYFKGLIGGGMKESEMDIIPIDCDPLILRTILEYIYTEEEDILWREELKERMIDLFVKCHKFGVNGLTEILEDMLCENIDLENVVSLTILSDQLSQKHLLERCKQFIIKSEERRERIESSEIFKSMQTEMTRILKTTQ
eukprot:TRINITY_DN1520_c0_g3_i2.p1 TRINITY_DN1520_c0_g3~~TRINITY_DN1520_c0_g3_i2.p1  ORF type:complete len:1020 (+),score=229.46 TRINITY_DN1520_c0_g3_i2:61-3060(+)